MAHQTVAHETVAHKTVAHKTVAHKTVASKTVARKTVATRPWQPDRGPEGSVGSWRASKRVDFQLRSLIAQ